MTHLPLPVPHGLDLVILTGFLGSGKTTLLQAFLERPEASDTAIIVNEVGEVGIDDAILRENGGRIAVTTLTNGCLCCQMGSDLTGTIEALLDHRPPDGPDPLRRIVVETSGLSRPGPILRQLATLAFLRLRVTVVATYDAEQGPAMATHPEALAQWAAAETVVLTKLDRVTAARAEEARQEAGQIDPLARIVAEPDRAVAAGAMFAAAAPRACRRQSNSRLGWPRIGAYRCISSGQPDRAPSRSLPHGWTT